MSRTQLFAWMLVGAAVIALAGFVAYAVGYPGPGLVVIIVGMFCISAALALNGPRWARVVGVSSLIYLTAGGAAYWSLHGVKSGPDAIVVLALIFGTLLPAAFIVLVVVAFVLSRQVLHAPSDDLDVSTGGR